MVHERQDRGAIEQQALALAGVGHIGKLVRGNAQLLGENLPVPARLVEHIHEVGVLKDVLHLAGRKQVFDILRDAMFGPWEPEKFTVEDSAFGYIVMENGAAIILESSWALNCLDVGEAITMLCGTKAGADMKDGLRINGVLHDAQFVTRPAFQAGGVDFYSGETADAPTLEQKTFANAILGKGELTVLPEQAAVVTRILDAVYESARTGKPVYFD